MRTKSRNESFCKRGAMFPQAGAAGCYKMDANNKQGWVFRTTENIPLLSLSNLVSRGTNDQGLPASCAAIRSWLLIHIFCGNPSAKGTYSIFAVSSCEARAANKRLVHKVRLRQACMRVNCFFRASKLFCMQNPLYVLPPSRSLFWFQSASRFRRPAGFKKSGWPAGGSSAGGGCFGWLAGCCRVVKVRLRRCLNKERILRPQKSTMIIHEDNGWKWKFGLTRGYWSKQPWSKEAARITKKTRMKNMRWIERTTLLSQTDVNEKKDMDQNYSTSSDHHRDMSGEGCHVRVVI